ncbi:MAG: hypothetical protein ABF289_19475 [Clostridiales bacterium]
MEINIFGNKYDGDKLKDEMIAHLEKKYNKKFYPILLEPKGYQIDYDKLKVYPAGGDEETDFAHIAKFEKGKKVEYIDNYFGIHIRSEYESIIEREAKKVFNNVKVFTSFYAHSFSDELTCENSFEDALKIKELMNASITIYVKEEDMKVTFSDKIKKLEGFLKKANIRGAYNMSHLKSGNFDGVSRKNYKDYTKPFTKKFDEICWEEKTGRISD